MSDSSYDSEVLEADAIIAVLRGELETLRQENLLLRQLLQPYQDGLNAIVDALETVSTATARLPHPLGQPVATAMPAMPASGYELGPPAAAGPPPEPVYGLLVEPSPEPASGSDVEVFRPPTPDGPPPPEDPPFADPPAGPPVPPPPAPPAPPAGPPPHGHGPLRQ